MSLGIFGDAQDGGGEVLLEVSDDLEGRIQHVQPVFVRSYPCEAVAAHHDARHGGIADDVMRSQLIAHIMEACRLSRVHIDAFLQQS